MSYGQCSHGHPKRNFIVSLLFDEFILVVSIKYSSNCTAVILPERDLYGC